MPLPSKIKMLTPDNLKYVKENLIIITATLFVAFCGYIFHFITGKKLGPEDYGLIVSLLAIIYIIDIFLQTLQSLITVKIAEATANNKSPSGLIKFFLYKNIKYGFIVSVVFIIAIPLIARFLHTSNYLVILLLSILILASFLLPVTRGFLQGTQQFRLLGTNYIIEGLSKMSLLLLLFYLGGGLASAITSISLSYLIPFLVALPLLPKLNVRIPKNINYKLITPITLIIAVLTLFYSTDILLVRYFFTAYETGLYSAISLYGKVMIFSAISVAMVLLPKSLEYCAKKRNPSILLKKSLLLMSVIGIPVIILYFAFPKIIISLTFGTKYLAANHLLGYYALGAFLISVSHIFAYHLISLKQEKRIWASMLLLWAIEPLLIVIYHNSLFMVITALNISAAILTLFLALYTIRLNKSKNLFLQYTQQRILQK